MNNLGNVRPRAPRRLLCDLRPKLGHGLGKFVEVERRLDEIGTDQEHGSPFQSERIGFRRVAPEQRVDGLAMRAKVGVELRHVHARGADRAPQVRFRRLLSAKREERCMSGLIFLLILRGKR